MKKFVTSVIALTFTLASADISFNSGYNYNGNNNVPQPQQILDPEQQSQYPIQNIIPNFFLKPSKEYLPQSQHQLQGQLLSQQQHKFDMQLPIPPDFSSKSSYQQLINTKPALRYRPRMRIPKKAIVTKHFFLHSAPEESQAEIDEELAALQQPTRKHYNVLFVKTPSQTNKAIALNLAKSVKEEKTVVYVLSKKTSAGDLQEALQEVPKEISKPEVFFIKYRTPEEAANAQHQIQAQYDSLGGSTSISDEGVAPATSVIGSLDAAEEDEEEHQQPQHQLLDNSQQQVQTLGHYDGQQLVNRLSSSTNNGYLPPSNQ